MSLVDYASSDEEQEEHGHLQPSELPSTAVAGEDVNGNRRTHHPTSFSSPPSSSSIHVSALTSRSTGSSSNQQLKDVSPLLPPPMEKLPDASMLLNSPTLSQAIGIDHSSRVAAAMAENASRKREVNGSSSSQTRSKIPRGNLPHSKNLPDTGSGQLVPPQLRGRSNVVTEDISKLFVRKNTEGKS